jgi:hypothetical protein
VSLSLENATAARSDCSKSRAAGPLKRTAMLEWALLASWALADVTRPVQVSPSSTTRVLRWLALKLISAR